MTKPWKIEYKEEPWASIHHGEKADGIGFYRISYEDAHYGFISKEAFDKQTTGDIMPLLEQMLNDSHDLALRQKDVDPMKYDPKPGWRG